MLVLFTGMLEGTVSIEKKNKYNGVKKVRSAFPHKIWKHAKQTIAENSESFKHMSVPVILYSVWTHFFTFNDFIKLYFLRTLTFRRYENIRYFRKEMPFTTLEFCFSAWQFSTCPKGSKHDWQVHLGFLCQIVKFWTNQPLHGNGCSWGTPISLHETKHFNGVLLFADNCFPLESIWYIAALSLSYLVCSI